jgi:hypothetical protein
MADVEVEPKRISLLDVIHKSKKEILSRITIVASVKESLTASKATKLAGVHNCTLSTARAPELSRGYPTVIKLARISGIIYDFMTVSLIFAMVVRV